MRSMHRILLLASLLAAAPILAGCEDLDFDKFDFLGLNQKKRLPGERKEVFPGGVPGVSQGIPPQYMVGNRPQVVETPATAPANVAAATAPPEQAKSAADEPAAEPKSKVKLKPKPKPKPRTAERSPAQVTVQRQQQQQQQQQQQNQQLAPWPDQQPAQGQTMAPWPAAPAPGTFSR